MIDDDVNVAWVIAVVLGCVFIFAGPKGLIIAIWVLVALFVAVMTVWIVWTTRRHVRVSKRKKLKEHEESVAAFKRRQLEEEARALSDEDMAWIVLTCEQAGSVLPAHIAEEYHFRRESAEEDRKAALVAERTATTRGRVLHAAEVGVEMVKGLTKRKKREALEMRREAPVRISYLHVLPDGKRVHNVPRCECAKCTELKFAKSEAAHKEWLNKQHTTRLRFDRPWG